MTARPFRSDSLTWLFASEIRYCSLLIGLIETLWAFVGLLPSLPGSLFSATVRASGLGDVWFFVMFFTGFVLFLGSVFPWRSGRHIGLFLSSLVWFVTFGVFIDMAFVAPVVISMPIFGGVSILLMYSDAKRKPRKGACREER